MAVPVAGAPGLSINAVPAEPRIGDTVTLSGTVTGINTIAVYLFVTGPGLDPRGVTLDNLNIPLDRGLFTTAPVNLQDGTWTYTWDTSVILGRLRPGNYSVHVVASPVERMRSNEGESAAVTVTFLPEPAAPAGAPVDPALPLAACAAAGLLCCTAGLKQK
jgi:hypothetical protein